MTTSLIDLISQTKADLSDAQEKRDRTNEECKRVHEQLNRLERIKMVRDRTRVLWTMIVDQRLSRDEIANRYSSYELVEVIQENIQELNTTDQIDA